MIEYTYIVTGYMRSGTSMMMNALSAGGLDPLIHPNRDALNGHFGDEDYKPNGDGFFEGDPEEYIRPDFPRDYQGKLIKVLRRAPLKLYPMPYRVVQMWRHPEEIRQSFERFFGTEPNMRDINNYWLMMAETAAAIKAQRDMDLVCLWYRDVITNPLAAFQKLAVRGWPIDIEKAAEIPVQDKVRCRIEDFELAGTLGI